MNLRFNFFRQAYSQQLVKGVAGTGLVFFSRIIIQSGSLIFLVSMLGSEGFGVFAAISAIAVLAGTLPTCGTHIVLMSDMVKGGRNQKLILSYALPLTFLLSVFLWLASSLLSWMIIPPATVWLAFVFSLGFSEIVIQPLLLLLISDLQGRCRPVAAQILLTTPLFIRFIILACMFFYSFQSLQVLLFLSYLLPVISLIVLAGSYLYVGQNWRLIDTWRLPLFSEIRQAFGYGFLNFTALATGEIDKILAVKIMPISSVGTYAICSRVIGAVVLPLLALLTNALPLLFKKERAEFFNRFVITLIFVSFVYGVLVSVFLLIIAGGYFSHLDGYLQGFSTIMVWLLLAVPAMSLRLTTSTILVGCGFPWLRAYIEIIGLLLIIIFGFVMYYIDVSPSVPVAIFISECCMAFLGLWLIWIKMKS